MNSSAQSPEDLTQAGYDITEGGTESRDPESATQMSVIQDGHFVPARETVKKILDQAGM